VVTLCAPDSAFDVEELRAAITPRTKLILLNSPHNPTGKVFTREELATIATLAVDRDLVVVTDEVYEHLVYDGSHVPIATLPGMRDRTVTISSGGKTFSFTGWKVGWICASAELVDAVKTVKQFLTYVNAGPFQYAIAAGLALGDDYYTSFLADMRDKRDRLCAGLEQAGLEVTVPQGTYFVTTDIRTRGFDDGLAFCRSLPERCGVVAVPSAVFYDDKEAGAPLVRWACCKRPEVLDEAVARLKALSA
jgi:N-succinyldiaminopimelate aminotransferase